MKKFRFILNNFQRTVSNLFTPSVFVPLFVLAAVLLFLVELPTWILDLLLAANLLISLILLLHSLFIDRALRIFAFPTMLVLTTLFRLSLNVSSTKLILLHGDKGLDAAGEIIKAFGAFAVRGDFVVGAIVFAIVAVVNFVVIAKGSARVAEVAARFVLDALPGRQLAIDTEMRAGNISKKEAALRREELSRESQFFGAMDGAMKWVQGDAVAALVIVFINAVGGVALGVSRGLSFEAAVNSFGVLAIGDGLVSILPALLISVSAGVIVTHVIGREKRDSGDEIVAQLLADPRPPVLAALALLALSSLSLVGLIKFPFFPFFLMGMGTLLLVAGRTWFATVCFDTEIGPVENKMNFGRCVMPGDVRSKSGALDIAKNNYQFVKDEPFLAMETVRVAVSPQVLKNSAAVANNSMLDANTVFTADFEKYAQSARQEVYRSRGIILPQILLVADAQVVPGSFIVYVRGRVDRRGLVPERERLVASSPNTLRILGFEPKGQIVHPISRRTCSWVEAEASRWAPLRHLKLSIYEKEEYLVQQAVAAVFERIDEFFGLSQVKQLLSPLIEAQESLLAEIFDAGRLSYPEFSEILRRLVRERVSILDLRLILEGVVEFCALNSPGEDRQEWLAELHAFLRVVLQRSIVDGIAAEDGQLRTFSLSPDIEDEFRSAIASWGYSRVKLAMEPDFENALWQNAQRLFAPVLERGAVPIVVLCPQDIRPAVQDFFGRQMAGAEWIRTLAYQELTGDCRPQAIGVLSI